jgi:hypothetical protein
MKLACRSRLSRLSSASPALGPFGSIAVVFPIYYMETTRFAEFLQKIVPCACSQSELPKNPTSKVAIQKTTIIATTNLKILCFAFPLTA